MDGHSAVSCLEYGLIISYQNSNVTIKNCTEPLLKIVTVHSVHGNLKFHLDISITPGIIIIYSFQEETAHLEKCSFPLEVPMI